MAAVKVSLFVLLLLIVYASAARTARTNLRKSDKDYRILERECLQSLECSQLFEAFQPKCVRMCVSEKCYKELEPGEIDQRKGAFRNCVLGGGSDEYKASKASDGDYDQ